MAMQMTVVGQVHLSRLQYENASRVLDRSTALASADQKIEKFTADGNKSGTHSQADLVEALTVSIISELRRYQSIAQVYAANGRLQASLGVEPGIGDVQNTSLKDLTAQVAQAMASWRSGDGIKAEAQAIAALSQPAATPVLQGGAGPTKVAAAQSASGLAPATSPAKSARGG
jgi:hypothetical protein